MDIDIDELGESGTSLDHRYGKDDLDLGEEHARLIEDPEIHVRAVRDGDRILIKGGLQALVEVICDRCLKNVEAPLNPIIDVIYAPVQMIGAEGAHEIGNNDLDFSFFEGNLINVDDLVKEQILLALPSRILCTEDCKGLCPDCGADRNRVDDC